MWKKETKTKTVKKLIVVLAALAVLFILGLSFAGVFRVRQVTVTGNAYYTKEEVVDLLLDEGSLQNTLLVYLRYKYQEHPEIPFIDDFEVTMDSWQSLKIRVYEKNMVGYVRYLGQDVYFDKDGIVVESSTQELEGIPQISGVTFDSLAIHQPLSVEDPTIFDTILSITKLLTKYDLDPDEIRFGAGGELFLQLGDVKVALGTGENLDEKISRLKQLEGDLKDKSGTLHMENYTDETTHISLESAK
ncbi:cell division protein FtsQ/DivIB [Hominiventricola aquisgranensis]|jgi:cell division protein FtsQ|uniref:Cell division protein FtsQ/DivIB n=1 Tax=Hominiventricola aquisgranensis TaxID=3133164 RepID=A0ABV1I293_9FIRM|nr:cell division protein FtsQ [Clostridiales bacterium AM23-16LB]RHO82349.1 cell division protein FtsQ [Clostridiaceae bacterium AF42-6]RHP52879.1 cell division protein FtsQ [Clostridiaceae bacterium AF31-3BH]RHQ26961.1 cell division protein FtsQ [Clostridiaceae bacterium AF29-16BH]RHR44374.1 cell division protein FtsQ [Clostridiaceae bacterium AF18-31LB]RHT84083.1 cell division protein FtsQ [Clostridiaceae bacterium AM27-36LB]